MHAAALGGGAKALELQQQQQQQQQQAHCNDTAASTPRQQHARPGSCRPLLPTCLQAA